MGATLWFDSVTWSVKIEAPECTEVQQACGNGFKVKMYDDNSCSCVPNFD